jgi:glutaredoxin
MYSKLLDKESLSAPQASGYTIYSRSGCPYCDLSKELLAFETVALVDCDEFLEQNREEFLRIMQNYCGRSYQMFPMIFHNGVFLGGYTEAKEFYQNRLVEMLDDF